jgi:hypothetical protein
MATTAAEKKFLSALDAALKQLDVDDAENLIVLHHHYWSEHLSLRRLAADLDLKLVELTLGDPPFQFRPRDVFGLQQCRDNLREKLQLAKRRVFGSRDRDERELLVEKLNRLSQRYAALCAQHNKPLDFSIDTQIDYVAIVLEMVDCSDDLTTNEFVLKPDCVVLSELADRLHKVDWRIRRLESGAVSDNGPTHSLDFRSVNWHGEVYSFNASQAKVVKVLWGALERNVPEVGDETLLLAVDENAPPTSLRNLFRDHEAWGRFIVPGRTKGSHRLANL